MSTKRYSIKNRYVIKMKIGIFTPTFINNHSKSGISNAAYLIVKNLIEKYE